MPQLENYKLKLLKEIMAELSSPLSSSVCAKTHGTRCCLTNGAAILSTISRNWGEFKNLLNKNYKNVIEFPQHQITRSKRKGKANETFDILPSRASRRMEKSSSSETPKTLTDCAKCFTFFGDS